MTKSQKEFARLASILDLMIGEDEDQADAAKSLDELRQDLVAMGFDVKQVLEAVGAPVERWLNKCGIEVDEEELSPRGASSAGFTAVAPVERWTPQVVQMAFQGRSRPPVGQFIARLPALGHLNLEPHLLIGLVQTRLRYTLSFVLEQAHYRPRASAPPLRWPQTATVELRRTTSVSREWRRLLYLSESPWRCTRHLSIPGGWTSQIKLLRGGVERATVVMSRTVLFRETELRNYRPGEESEWEVEVVIQRRSRVRKP